jgi:hypothetical protein
VLSLEQRWISLLNILLTCLFNLFCLNIIPKKRNGKSGHLWDREPWPMRKTWSSCHHSPPLFHKKRNGNIYEIERHGPWERCDHLVSPSPFDCRKCRQTSGRQMHVQSSRGQLWLRAANQNHSLCTMFLLVFIWPGSQMQVKVWSPSHHNWDGNPCNKIGKEKF